MHKQMPETCQLLLASLARQMRTSSTFMFVVLLLHLFPAVLILRQANCLPEMANWSRREMLQVNQEQRSSVEEMSLYEIWNLALKCLCSRPSAFKSRHVGAGLSTALICLYSGNAIVGMPWLWPLIYSEKVLLTCSEFECAKMSPPSAAMRDFSHSKPAG